MKMMVYQERHLNSNYVHTRLIPIVIRPMKENKGCHEIV